MEGVGSVEVGMFQSSWPAAGIVTTVKIPDIFCCF